MIHDPAVRQIPAREALPMHVLVVLVMRALVDDWTLDPEDLLIPVRVGHWMQDLGALPMLGPEGQLTRVLVVLAMRAPVGHVIHVPAVAGIAQPFAAVKLKKLATQPQRNIFHVSTFPCNVGGCIDPRSSSTMHCTDCRSISDYFCETR